MLGDFFRITMPYGLEEVETGVWYAFNREYMPVGFNNYSLKSKSPFKEYPIHTKYKLTNSLIKKIEAFEGSSLQVGEKSKLRTLFFYNDKTNPVNRNKPDDMLWELYMKKLYLIGKVEGSLVELSNH